MRRAQARKKALQNAPTIVFMGWGGINPHPEAKNDFRAILEAYRGIPFLEAFQQRRKSWIDRRRFCGF